MPLFSSQENPQNSQNELTKPQRIEESVLKNLNLTQEDIDSTYRDQLLEASKKEVVEEAVKYYKDGSTGALSFKEPKPVKLGTIALQPKEVQGLAQIPDRLKEEFTRLEPALNAEDKEHIKIYLETFCENFGATALSSKDWESTVCAYDLSSEGGIIQKPEIIKKLGKIFSQEKPTREQIAKLIQQRLDMRKTLANQGSPSANVSREENPPSITTAPTPSSAPIDIDAIRPTQPDTQSNRSFNEIAQERSPLIEPVGTPNTPILGETNLRPAPPNPGPQGTTS